MNFISDEIVIYLFNGEFFVSEDLFDSNNEVLVIKLINIILVEVIKELVLDIYIEFFGEKIMIRFCIDGVLKNILELL